MTTRTRFAPSPTGNLHIGNIRAAIFNWLFARHEGGQFLLRIEDTDRERSTKEACENVLEAMEWLGLTFDETELYQSTRMEAHLAAAEDLLSRGLAYKEDKGGTGQGEAVIFRMPGTDAAFTDLVKGDLAKKAEDMKDFVIVRSNGTPVFHLANVVDDIHMGVTHVIRGDDHVENTFRHLALYQALGADLPKFGHLPMIVNAQGKPYSKRDGDAYVGEFREKGFLAEALFNYLALLGWNPGDDREVLSLDELVEAFSLDRVQSSAAQMDIQKLSWMNGQHMHKKPAEELVSQCGAVLQTHGVEADQSYLLKVLELLGDRICFYEDIWDKAGYFFTDKVEINVPPKAHRKAFEREGQMEALAAIQTQLSALEDFSAASIEPAVNTALDSVGMGHGKMNLSIRVAATGTNAGADLLPTLELIGKERVCKRLAAVLG